MRDFKRLAIFCLILTLVVPDLPARTRKGEKFLTQGREAEARKQWETALDLYEQAMLEDPVDSAYQAASRRVRFQAGSARINAGQKLRAEGRLEEALHEFQRAYAIDPSAMLAESEIRRTREMIERERSPATRSATPEERGMTPAEKSTREAEEKASRMMALPELKPMQRQITTLRMNNQPVKVLYETVGKLAGINVILDPEYQNAPGKSNYTVDLSNTTLEEALDYLSIQTKSYWKPLSTNTIFVTNDNVQKRRDYEDYVVKVFYIKNATTVQELQEISTTIRSVTEIRRAFTYNAQYAILVRGTADQVALAEKLVQDLDKPKNEVVIDVIVMEANRSRIRDLALTFQTAGAPGINLPIGYNRTATDADGKVTGGSQPLNNIRLGLGDYSLNVPSFLIQALLSDTSSRVLQQPQVRAVEMGKASLKIGDRIPYATGSFQPGVGSVGLNPLVSTQFQFLDTGVNVDIVPKIHGKNEVSLHVEIDLSTKSNEVDLGGLKQPVVSRRTIVQDIRLREGEVNLMGGLLSQQETRIRSGVPGLMDLPVIGRLFSTEKIDKPRGELLMVLIPHIIRAPDYSESNLRGVSAGNDQNVKLNYSPRPEPAPMQVAPAPNTAAPNTAVPPAQPQAITPVTPSPAPAATAPAPIQPAASPTPAPAAPAPTPMAAGSARLSFQAPSATVALSAPITVSLQAENIADLFSAPVRLKFDPKMLRVTSVQAGSLMGGDGQKIDFTPNVMNETGDVAVNLSRTPGSGGVSGSGTVLTVTFQAIGRGASKVQVLDASFRNTQLLPVPVGSPTMAIDVQ
ncbi:MAG: cohesin domain-containing protein [Bryobacteraceae bacterium]|nr:cohesin domain-containing protein [Bryobacteraceae bacterium]